MSEESYSKKLTKIFTLVEEWHKKTEPNFRLIEDLLADPEIKEWLKVMPPVNMRILALMEILELKHLDYKLTRRTADAAIRPFVSPDPESYSYEFFLDHYHEHPYLVEMIRKSILGPFRLRIVPVILADGYLVAWLFDPWNMLVYKFEINHKGEAPCVIKKRGKIEKSVGERTILMVYKGKDHPFSKKYLQKLRWFKKGCKTKTKLFSSPS